MRVTAGRDVTQGQLNVSTGQEVDSASNNFLLIKLSNLLMEFLIAYFFNVWQYLYACAEDFFISNFNDGFYD